MRKKFLTAAIAISLLGNAAAAKPLIIQEQGSFMAGGKVITAAGKYDGSKPTDFAGETLNGDHSYVFYQIPTRAKKYSPVFLHGHGQSGKSWETTPDGREGFQNIFLRKKYPVYIVDQPRRGRGRAGQSTEPYNFPAQPDNQLWYNTFRIGEYPNYYDNAKVPRDAESLNQFFSQMTPRFPTEQKNIANAIIAVFENCNSLRKSQGGNFA